MFSFILKLFKRKNKKEIDYEAVVREYWELDFSKPNDTRFELNSNDTYNSKLLRESILLKLNKKHLYAWCLNNQYRYKDFVLEGKIEFPNKNTNLNNTEQTNAGSFAAGFLFRYISESSFYSVLISDKGFVRMDAVFNGNPIPILGWTELVEADEKDEGNQGKEKSAVAKVNACKWQVKIIARATSFTIILNNKWLAEIFDDTIQSPGKIAFAGQNWGVFDDLELNLTSFCLDSRPIEIEALHSRWNTYLPVTSSARKNLAKTFFAMGSYIPALLELQKAKKTTELNLEESIMMSQIYKAQGLYEEAENSIKKTLERFPFALEAISEFAGLLYLQDRFNDLEKYLASIDEDMVKNSSFLLNLKAHYLSYLGESKKAADMYLKAGNLAPDQGLFFLYAGNELEKSGNLKDAYKNWLTAGNLFLTNEFYTDLEAVLEKLNEHKEKTIFTNLDKHMFFSLKGKYLYAIGDTKSAFNTLKKSLDILDSKDEKNIDSAVFYLCGLIASQSGDYKNAIECLTNAYNKNPNYSLYVFRLAETLFYANEDCNVFLEKALELDNSNAWVHNLATLKNLKENNLEKAKSHSKKALEILPNETNIIINYAEVFRQMGKLDDVLPILEQNSFELLYAGANLLVADNRFEEAEKWYQKASKLNPNNPELLVDRAANCIELGHLNEADDLLGRAFEIELSPRLFRLISYIASRKGEFARAEITLLEANEHWPNDIDILNDLAFHWIHTNKTEKAKETIELIHSLGSFDLVKKLEKEYNNRHNQSFSCSMCSQTWWVPKNIPPQASLRIYDEPPGNMPAGSCPACKSIYCIECGKNNMDSTNRFICSKCNENLKLNDSRLIFVLSEWVKKAKN